MSTFTLADIKLLVQEPIDIEAEDFVSDDELTRYINAGIREAEAEIHNVYQDYYLASPFTMPIVSGTASYVLPSDIYATKIRKVIFDDGSDAYVIKRIRDLEDIPYVQKLSETTKYVYMVTNDLSGGEKITLYPTPDKDLSTEVKIYYLREAAQLTNPSDEIDIPEFVDFVVLFARYEAIKKELGNPLIGPTKEEMEAKRTQMINTLLNRFPDGDSTILQDISAYEDFYYGIDYWD